VLGRGLGGSHASGASAARGVGAAAPCARAVTCGRKERSICALAVSAGRGRGAQVDARLLDELRDRRDPSPGACAIGAKIARATVNGAAEERVDERGEDRGGRDAHPPRRLQTLAKLVALSPLPRISLSFFRARGDI
jgi:hypothetical protein